MYVYYIRHTQTDRQTDRQKNKLHIPAAQISWSDEHPLSAPGGSGNSQNSKYRSVA